MCVRTCTANGNSDRGHNWACKRMMRSRWWSFSVARTHIITLSFSRSNENHSNIEHTCTGLVVAFDPQPWEWMYVLWNTVIVLIHFSLVAVNLYLPLRRFGLPTHLLALCRLYRSSHSQIKWLACFFCGHIICRMTVKK